VVFIIALGSETCRSIHSFIHSISIAPLHTAQILCWSFTPNHSHTDVNWTRHLWPGWLHYYQCM